MIFSAGNVTPTTPTHVLGAAAFMVIWLLDFYNEERMAAVIF